MCFETCHKVFYLFGCGCEWRLPIHTKEQEHCFGFFFFFFFKHKYQEILTERKYVVHQSCKGAFSILFTHAGQSEEMESVTSPTALSYFSTLWHFYTQLTHQMCLFLKTKQNSDIASERVVESQPCALSKRAVSFSDHILSTTISFSSHQC